MLLFVFPRASAPGKVKMHLAITLGKERALQVDKRLLQHTIEHSAALDVDRQAWYADEVVDPGPCAEL